jgi:AcrR family transcriptional regulator
MRKMAGRPREFDRDKALERAMLAFWQRGYEGTSLARVLRDAVATYTDDAHPLGCMVVTAATNCAEENEEVAAWLAGHRRQRTQSLVDRLQQALDEGELRAGTNVQALGDFYATQLHGISVQARDGVPRDRLLAAVDTALLLLDQALQPAGQTR